MPPDIPCHGRASAARRSGCLRRCWPRARCRTEALPTPRVRLSIGSARSRRRRRPGRSVPGLIVGAEVLLPEGRRPGHAAPIRFNGGIGAVAQGSIYGRFYGPGHEEAGGLFHRDGFAGAFAGKRDR